MDWDTLRWVLAVARSGTLSGAAKTLGVTHSTVLRRLDALEKNLGVRLFERRRDGYGLTQAGEVLRNAALNAEPIVDEAERLVLGKDLRLQGLIRLTTSQLMQLHILPQPLAQFCQKHPDIEVQVTENRAPVDLARREADVALRINKTVPEWLIGRRLGQVKFNIYTLHDPQSGTPKPRKLPLDKILNSKRWITFERDVHDRIYDRWLHAHVPDSSVVMRADTFTAVMVMLKATGGYALLPQFMELRDTTLVRVHGPIDELSSPLWLLTHPDLRRTARIRLFMQDVGDAIAEQFEHIDKLD